MADRKKWFSSGSEADVPLAIPVPREGNANGELEPTTAAEERPQRRAAKGPMRSQRSSQGNFRDAARRQNKNSFPLLMALSLVAVSAISFAFSYLRTQNSMCHQQSLNCTEKCHKLHASEADVSLKLPPQQLPREQKLLEAPFQSEGRQTEGAPHGEKETPPPYLPPVQSESSEDRDSPLRSEVPPNVLRILQDPWTSPVVPVVQVFIPIKTDLCEGFLGRTLRQARSRNSVVYLIGDDKYKEMCKDMGVHWEPYSAYKDTVDWFDRNYGNVLPEGAPLNALGWNVKFFVMKLFMERHRIPRIFFTDSDVLLFANVTELTAMFYRDVPLALSYRWPSLQHRGPRHTGSISASTHVSIWTYDALCDFLQFFHVFFKEKVMPRLSAEGQLLSTGPYNDMWLLGWYTFKDCWMHRFEDLHPPCVSDSEAGFTPDRTAKIRGKFVPKYPVVSLNQPRWCRETSWSSAGWCAFDNNFAARASDTDPVGQQTPKVCFKYKSEQGMKCPTSDIYTYFEDWSEDGKKQDSPVQYLAVHFQGRKKCLLNPWERDSDTWACG